MDISLERIHSLIPKKPDGKFMHGAKKAFCESIGAPPNIMSEWERGVSRSYRNYFYQMSERYNVSVEWLKGETDIKEKPPAKIDEELLDASLIDKLIRLTPAEMEKVDAFVRGLLAARLDVISPHG